MEDGFLRAYQFETSKEIGPSVFRKVNNGCVRSNIRYVMRQMNRTELIIVKKSRPKI